MSTAENANSILHLPDVRSVSGVEFPPSAERVVPTEIFPWLRVLRMSEFLPCSFTVRPDPKLMESKVRYMFCRQGRHPLASITPVPPEHLRYGASSHEWYRKLWYPGEIDRIRRESLRRCARYRVVSIQSNCAQGYITIGFNGNTATTTRVWVRPFPPLA